MPQIAPVPARFRASQDARLVASDGSRCQNVKAGEEVMVHPKLFEAAMTNGMIPLESFDEKLQIVKPEKIDLPQSELEHNKLVEVCEQLIARGVAKNFTVHGYPKVSVVRELADFDMTAAQVRDAFDAAMHKVKMDGDDNQEHS